ncbi:MAG: hypothetical protein MJ238_07410, partial [Bacilli bacterium]|nr:hypothetical protein [Bacilli bacterium]
MKRKPLLVLAAMSMLVACGGTGSTNSNGSNVENNSGVSSTDIGSSSIDLGSSLTSSSKKVTYDSTPSTNDHSVDDIYDMIEELSLTNTFHQKIYTADDILSFTYKENEYIAQAGGEFEYSAIRLKDYKKDSNDYRVFLAPWEAQEDGSKSYRIGEAIYLYDYYEMKAVAPETSLLEYSPTFLYDEYKTLYNEILETDKKNVFEMNYKASWGLLGNGNRTFYAY